jgi:hypothetical protein
MIAYDDKKIGYRGKYSARGQGSITSSTHGFSSAAPSTHGLGASTHGLGASTHGLGASTHGLGGFMGFREGGREGSICTDIDKRDGLRVNESYVQLLYVPLFATLEDSLGGDTSVRFFDILHNALLLKSGLGSELGGEKVCVFVYIYIYICIYIYMYIHESELLFIIVTIITITKNY